MARIAWILVSVAAGVVAALLLVAGPTVQVDGREESCPGIVVAAEGGRGPDACQAVQTRWTLYAVGAGLVSLVAGTGAAFRYPRQPKHPDMRQESIDNQ